MAGVILFKASLPVALFTSPEACRSPPPSLLFSASKPRVPILSLRLSSHPRTTRVSFCLRVGKSGENCASDDASSSSKEAAFDIKLPRRSLLVQFTCGACGERTQRLVNRVAYERGTIFVQCAGCLVHHKLVDNLGLVVEYDLRENIDTNSDDKE